MNQFLLLIFQLAVLLFSVVIHEVSHGLAALRLGDQTAKNAGRLTLNPFNHLDLFGSIILPITLFIISGGTLVLGWAKPVPYNPENLKNPKTGAGVIAAVGPLSNVIIAVVFGIILRLIYPFAGISVIGGLVLLLNFIVFINILLAIFNLVPLPPLDGSNILFAVIPSRWHRLQQFLLRYGFWILILLIFFGFQLLTPIIGALYHLIVGPASLF